MVDAKISYVIHATQTRAAGVLIELQGGTRENKRTVRKPQQTRVIKTLVLYILNIFEIWRGSR